MYQPLSHEKQSNYISQRPHSRYSRDTAWSFIKIYFNLVWLRNFIRKIPSSSNRCLESSPVISDTLYTVRNTDAVAVASDKSRKKQINNNKKKKKNGPTDLTQFVGVRTGRFSMEHISL